MKLPRWGSRVRIPSSAPQRGSLTCDNVRVPGTGASFLGGYSHESPTKSCRGGVGVHPGLAKKASKGEWTGETPPFGYLQPKTCGCRIEVLDPFGPERHSRTARSCSADAGTARSLGRQTGCRSSSSRPDVPRAWRTSGCTTCATSWRPRCSPPASHRPRCPSASATPGRRPPSMSTRIQCRGVTARGRGLRSDPRGLSAGGRPVG